MTVIEIISEIKKLGVSKYKIAKEMGISWNTIHGWTKGKNMRADNLKKLTEIYKTLTGK